MKRLYLLILLLIISGVTPLWGNGAQGPHKVALVLSGGGARGASHVGVLRILEQERIPINCIAGTSFGALVGGLFSIGYSTEEIERILSSQDWNSILSDAPERRLTPLLERRDSRYQAQLSFRGWVPELPAGFGNGQRLTEALDVLTTSRMLIAGYDFDRLPIQFRAVATNLIDGEVHVFTRGSMTEALRASMAIPLLFTPVEKDGMLLVDGGLTNNLPTDVARDLGADIIIAVDATSPLQTKEMIRNFVDVVDQSISLQMEKNVRENRGRASLVLQPELDRFTNSDYDRFGEILVRGKEEARRNLARIKALTASVPLTARPKPPVPSNSVPTVQSIAFRGLVHIKPEQLNASIRVHPGDAVDPAAIGADIDRLYATRLFESVAYTLEPLAANRFDLAYIVKESLFNSLGAGLRYDNDYTFVALAEFNARQLFNSPSNAAISSQFGGLEDHVAALRLVPSAAPFFFLEPRAEVLRLERLDIRDQQVVDRFTDKRESGRLMIGGSFFNHLEVSAGYRIERVRIDEGSEPNRMDDSTTLAGFLFRLNRDTLDSRDFPRSGMAFRLSMDKRARSLGSDTDYSKMEAEFLRPISFSAKSSLQVNAALGYSRGPVPFFDLFFVGGYSFSQISSRQFLGLQRDELPVRQMAILTLSYRRVLVARALSFIRRGYITGIYNSMLFSDRQDSPYNFDFLHGAGIGLALDTMIGPVRATGGWSEGGRFNFYISVGPSF
jgi:NTE family protein